MLVLVYETFATSLSAAIERLEDSFNCSVAAHIHREILSTLNPAAVREAIEQMDLGHFDKYDQQSHSTAGRHIAPQATDQEGAESNKKH